MNSDVKMTVVKKGQKQAGNKTISVNKAYTSQIITILHKSPANQ